jgi:SAM-dependent methyltransferase
MSDHTAPFRCLLCEGTQCHAEITNASDRFLGYRGTYDYVRCQNCGLVQQHPVPTDTAEFYAAYPVHRRRSSIYRLARKLLMPGVYFRQADLRGKCVLDFGCGNGDFLLEMKNAGATVYGYEFDADFAARTEVACGVPIMHDTRALQAHAGTLDVVTLHCVLEHLTDLRSTFALVASLLKPGGQLYLVLPRFDSWDRRLFGRYWHSLDPPRHISFPDVPHIESLGQSHGLSLERFRDVCFPNNITASLSALLFGRAKPVIFLPLTPVGLAFHCLISSGTRSFSLRKAAN